MCAIRLLELKSLVPQSQESIRDCATGPYQIYIQDRIVESPLKSGKYL